MCEEKDILIDKIDESKEATLVGFKIVLDREGRLLTEICGLPLEQCHKVFEQHPEKYTFYKLIKEARAKLKETITYLEQEIGAL